MSDYDPIRRSPGRELSAYREPEEANRQALTWAERIWVYNVILMLPVYAAVAVAADLLAGADGWRDPTFSPWAVVTIVVPFLALAHLWSWILETMFTGRRAIAIVSRPLREGRHTWAIADGDRVRVYRIIRRHSRVPHMWPLALGIRGQVQGGREFSAEDEAAFEYVREVERASRPDAVALALARVINDRESPD